MANPGQNAAIVGNGAGGIERWGTWCLLLSSGQSLLINNNCAKPRLKSPKPTQDGG